MEAYSSGTGRWAGVASMPTAHEYLAAAIGPDANGSPASVKAAEAYAPGTNSLPTVR